MLPIGSRSGSPPNPRKYQGGWIDLAIKGAATLLGRSDAKKAEKRAAQDRDRELQLQERGVIMAEEQDRRAGRLFDHYAGTYLPRERALVSDVFDNPITADQAEREAVVDARGAFENARQIQGRNQRRLGINPASGAALSLDAGRSLEEARIEGATRTRAREGVRDLNFARQTAVLGMGQPTAATPYASMATSGVAQAGSLASARARGSDTAAYESAYNYGASLGELADAGLEAWRNRRGPKGMEAGAPYDDRYRGVA